MAVVNRPDAWRSTVLRRPKTALLGLFGVLLVLDLLFKLAGLNVTVSGTKLIGGSLAFSGLAILVKDGVMRGLVIGLAGIGLSMTYSILNFANFSHGDYITFGAFGGMSASYVVAGGFGASANIGSLVLVGAGGSVFGAALGIGVFTSPLAVLVGVVVACLVTIGLSLLVDRLVYQPIRDRSGITLLITSIGVAFVIRYLILFVYGGSQRGVTTSQPSLDLVFIDGTVPVNLHDATLFVVAVSLMGGLHLLLQRTKLGKAMRAMADNEDLARITGIPTERVVTYTWVIGGGLTGIAGYMLMLWKGTMGFFDGWLLLLLIFAAVILGGIGSVYGAIVGGLVIGLTASVSVVWVPTGLSRAAAFLVMIVILLVRPQGIFSGRATA